MTKESVAAIVEKQRQFFSSGKTLSVEYRIAALKRLKYYLIRHETEIAAALRVDLGKAPIESFMSEIGLTICEINYMLRHIRGFAKEKTVHTPIIQTFSHSYTKPAPYGVTLIMSPWNYPLMLTLTPLADALAAGNTCVLKPSAYAPNTMAMLQTIIARLFPPDYVAVVTGGREENATLLDEAFDYIFFTGSKAVGNVVLQKAAVHLTPVTLELGGKSPCVIDKTANLRLAARRAVFGKLLNCGQTCVAPDYFLCEESIKDQFIECLKKEIHRQFGGAPLQNENYGKIINQKHFDRLRGLIDPDKVVYGGRSDASALKIEPTIMDHVTRGDAVMQEEIFGPLLPILTVKNLDEAAAFIRAGEKPLALYIFTGDGRAAKKMMRVCDFGGGCINDTVIHVFTSGMGFGGVGASGMGAYHGKAGFETFSHKKSIVNKLTILDLRPRYQPYTKINALLTRVFMR
ncbi:MAG: aldehyde dehydrogenase [Clostridia bacterium]|nr:aldehyde dehydrogenase [Clostridia bacterium]